MTTTTNHPSTTPTTRWEAGKYKNVSGSGMRKLAESGIAPLVALARGYETIEALQVADFAKRNGLGQHNARSHTQLRDAAGRGDVLMLPWFSAEGVAQNDEKGEPQYRSLLQMRPAHPRQDERGRAMKYEFFANSTTVIDSHPAMPHDWFRSSSKILITEGVIKGDSALTAMLLASGLERSELEVSPSMTRSDAAERLSELMTSVAPARRTLILSSAGVSSWHGKSVWEHLPLSGRQVLLAFDGDVATNWNVWNQANKLWIFAASQRADLRLVDLDPDLDDELVELASGISRTEKVGLDDFLVTYGGWDTILNGVLDELPDAPPRSDQDFEPGTWMVSPDRCTVQEFQSSVNGGGPGWKIKVRLGGEVESVISKRFPTDEEIETGNFGEGVSDEGSPTNCRVKLSWISESGETHNATITGPADLLGIPVSRWYQHAHHIPPEILQHPEWPPTNDRWLKAIKSANDGQAPHTTAWASMGWVPVQGSQICAFISGRTVIAISESARETTIPGVTDSVLPDSGDFTLPPMPGIVSSEQWKKQVADDLKDVYERFIVDSPWSDPNYAAVVLAAALRPSIPIRTSTNLYLQGPPGQGKSWTASMVMAFHQKRLVWTNKHLPGSMKDTATAVEQALAQTNIWVMDDLAPSPDKRQNDVEQSKIGDIIRSVHNGTSKRRSGSDLKARETFPPRAVMITTAENEHVVGSVRDRSVLLTLDKTSLRGAAIPAMEEFRDENRAGGRLMVACVQAIQARAQSVGWQLMMGSLRGTHKSLAARAKSVLEASATGEKTTTRHAEMAADLMLGLYPLQILAEFVSDRRMMEALDPENPESLPARVIQALRSSYLAQNEASPGRSFLDVLSQLLRTGAAHVVNANDPALPPMSNADDAKNQGLGWRNDGHGWKAQGLTIGWAGFTTRDPDSSVDLISFDANAAFDLAKRLAPSTLPPGTSSNGAWQPVWSEKLIHPRYVSKRESSRINLKLPINGTYRRAVPIHIDKVLGERVASPPSNNASTPHT